MKKIFLILGILFVLLSTSFKCDDWLDSSYSIFIDNKSEDVISSYFALGESGGRHILIRVYFSKKNILDMTLNLKRELIEHYILLRMKNGMLDYLKILCLFLFFLKIH
ncbi:hypothetical protein LJB92_04505 [Bacteroidales bacterium OttesenSCG-928-M06]|nr:hypothetical protein [Bacteroidales bacterium OttesenSCG-928-M06]